MGLLGEPAERNGNRQKGGEDRREYRLQIEGNLFTTLLTDIDTVEIVYCIPYVHLHISNFML